MDEITRRRFIETASLAAAVPSLAAAPQSAGQPAPTRATSSRATSRARDLTDAELEAMFRRCSNTGKWGPDDEQGTLNYITPAKRIAAAQLVKTGEYVKSTEDPATGLVDLGNDLGYRSGIVDWPNRYGYDRTTTQRTVMTVNAVLVYGAIASGCSSENTATKIAAAANSFASGCTRCSAVRRSR